MSSGLFCYSGYSVQDNLTDFMFYYFCGVQLLLSPFDSVYNDHPYLLPYQKDPLSLTKKLFDLKVSGALGRQLKYLFLGSLYF